MKTNKIISVLITIVEFDWIPFSLLMHNSVLEHIRTAFNFSFAEVRQNAQGMLSLIYLGTGIYTVDGEDYNVSRVEIEDRKLVIELEGHSKIAERFYIDMMGFLQKIAGKSDEARIVIQTKESVITAKMGFVATQLFDQKFLNIINTTVKGAASTPQGTAKIHPYLAVFRADYIPTDESLVDYRISLSRKDITLGPRDGTTLEERLFVSRAPLSTDDHIAFLEEVEKAYS